MEEGEGNHFQKWNRWTRLQGYVWGFDDKLEFYKKAFEGLKTTVEQNLHTAELQSTERNYVWEAALAAVQGFIASYAGATKNPDIDTVAGISLTYAESLIAEGKKRNHI